MLLSSRYGALWTSQFTSDHFVNLAKNDWANHLYKFTPAQIKAALDQSQDTHPKYPPKLGEIKQLCKLQIKEPLYQPKLIGNPAKRETVEESLKKMKASLK